MPYSSREIKQETVCMMNVGNPRLRIGSWDRRASMTSVLLLMLSLSGCNRELPMGQVSGTVTYEGRPVTEATVEFRPEKGPGAFGSIDGEGRYVLRSKSAGDGVVVGRNVVSIVPVVEFGLPSNPVPKKPIPPFIVPERFRRAETSGLVREVEPGNNIFDFELKD